MLWYHAPSGRVGPDLDLVDGLRIAVSDGRITTLEPGATAVSGDILLPGTVVPGLIDLHVHLMLDGGPDVVASLVGRGAEELVRLALDNAAAHLSAGVTSVRDLGSPRGLLETGVLQATPLRIAWAGAVTPPGGHGHFVAVEASGAAETRAAVEDAARRGAHWIKVFATGGVITTGSRPGDLLASREELRAAVEAAQGAGLRVAAHAHGTEGILAAIEAGCDTVEHVSNVDERVLAAFAASATTPVSTLVATDRFVRSKTIATSPAETVEKIREHAPREAASLRRLVDSGLVLGAGTDAGTTHNPHGWGLAEEARLLEAAGMPPLHVLRTLTAVNSAFIAGNVGWLAPGRQADLAVFTADPGTDLAALTSSLCTVVCGRIVSGGPLPVEP